MQVVVWYVGDKNKIAIKIARQGHRYFVSGKMFAAAPAAAAVSNGRKILLPMYTLLT